MLISYAQNFEDVMLWRALKDVINGFYIDIGANDPIEDSVSLAFYQNGWRGVHIEPVHEFAERIRLARPDEEVVEAAIASRRKSLTLYKVGDTGMSTGDAAIAAQHEAAGFPVESRVVPCLALSKILSRFEDRDIHWLKIDVEGMEKSVIDSWLPSTARPWIVVVESTEPNSPKQNFEAWEPALLNLGYEFIYFDGLNRFYVSAAQPQLKSAFGPGPNYFDDFSLTETSMFTRLLAVKQQESERNIADLDSKLAAHERRAAETQRAISARDREIARLNDELASREHIAAQARGALDARDRDVADLNDKLASQVQIAAEAQSAINARDHDIADLNDKLALQDRRAAEAQRAVAARDRDIANLNNDLASQKRAAAARDRDIANLTNELASQERAAAARDRDIANLTNDLTSQESKIAETQRALGARDRDIASLNDRLISQGHMTAEAQRELGLAREQIANLHSQIGALNNALSDSASPIMRNVRSAYAHVRNGVWAWVTFAPRSRPRRVVRKIVAEASQSSALKAVARVFFAPFPALKNRLRVAIENDRYLKLNAERSSEAGKREALIDHGQEAVGKQPTDRIFTFDATIPQTTFLFVGHTAICPTNTGVQRTVRGLATGFAANGVRVRYVKWDAASKQCVLIDSEERAHLSKWNGPNLTDEEKSIYDASPGQFAAAVETAVNGRLIVPEVVHASFQNHVVAMDLIVWARQRGIEIGFIFYDAIPLLRTEFAEMAPAHAQYMQHLRLADVVWPISRWSGRDLISFWSASERAGPKTMPPVLPLHLPAGSASKQRKADVRYQEDLILSVGTIEERKNQLQLIRAFQAHKESKPQSSWRLVLVGNLHPNVASEVQNAVESDASIRHLGHVSDEELEALYFACAFTIFPSIEEGFGLPILESLAHGKPCICANFGAMAELIEGGGCLPVNTHDLASVRDAMEELMNDLPLRQSLTEQACSRSMISWSDYAASVSDLIGSSAAARAKLGLIYYWVDLTASFPNNNGIQQFTRQLARELMSLGIRLIPVKWDRTTGGPGHVNKHELAFLANQDGPSPEQWSDWIAPEISGSNSWLVMTEVPLNLTASEQASLRRYAKERNLSHAAVFYGAVNSEMEQNCSERFLQGHREYMQSLHCYDLVLAISDSSRAELIKFLGRELTKPQSLEMQIEMVALSRELSNDPDVSELWKVYAEKFAKRLARHSNSDRSDGLSTPQDEVQQRSLAMRILRRPKLSLCISTYNRAEWLSINLKNWARLYPVAMAEVELFVCDNASTDHTEEVVKAYLNRSDISYWRNSQNVGMLGNLQVTASQARGNYIWIVGDDDLLMPGSIERILQAIDENPEASLVYLNYAYTRIDDARTVTNLETFFAEAIPIVPPEPDRIGPIKDICASNENFFTAIYTLVFRRDHAINAYSQNTEGRSFSTMLTAIPTTYYVLNNMMDEPGVWIGSPQIVVNMNVSWMKYAPLWILERIPEVYEVAERKGVACDDIDRWRRHTLPGVVHFFREIYRADPLDNAAYFSAARLVRRFKHLPEFSQRQSELVSVYEEAHRSGHPAATEPASEIFPACD